MGRPPTTAAEKRIKNAARQHRWRQRQKQTWQQERATRLQQDALIKELQQALRGRPRPPPPSSPPTAPQQASAPSPRPSVPTESPEAPGELPRDENPPRSPPANRWSIQLPCPYPSESSKESHCLTVYVSYGSPTHKRDPTTDRPGFEVFGIGDSPQSPPTLDKPLCNL